MYIHDVDLNYNLPFWLGRRADVLCTTIFTTPKQISILIHNIVDHVIRKLTREAWHCVIECKLLVYDNVYHHSDCKKNITYIMVIHVHVHHVDLHYCDLQLTC